MESLRNRTSPDDYRVFSRSLDGKVRSRHHAEYASWHHGCAWNGRRFERYPEYIVRADSVADVIDSLRFARSHGLKVSVKGSGHSYAGGFFRRDGLLLDLSALDGLEVHAGLRMAIAGPGVTAGQLTRALAAHGLAFPTGHGGQVGLGGFLLGGGLGINCDAWGGMSAFNLLAADVVTAEGRLLHVDERAHPDLFWAVRGGGPCLFLAVVRLYLRCWPMPGSILARTHGIDPAHLPAALDALGRQDTDRRLQAMLALGGGEGMAASVSATAFCDSEAQATALLDTFTSALSPWLEGPGSDRRLPGFEAIYRQTEEAMVSRRYRADNILGDDISGIARVLLERFVERPSPATFALVIPRPPHAYPDAAFSATGRFFVSTYAQWNDEQDDEANREWLAALYDALAPCSTRCYVNEFDLEGRSGSLDRCYSEAAWAQLRALRARYDPDGVFHDLFRDPLHETGAAHG